MRGKDPASIGWHSPPLLDRELHDVRPPGTPRPADPVSWVLPSRVSNVRFARSAGVAIPPGPGWGPVEDDWLWFRELFLRAAELCSVARRVRLDVGFFEQTIEEELARLEREPLTVDSLERAASSTSLVAAILRDAIPPSCINQTRALGVRIQRARAEGQGVAEVTRTFAQLLEDLRDRDFDTAATRLSDLDRGTEGLRRRSTPTPDHPPDQPLPVDALPTEAGQSPPRDPPGVGFDPAASVGRDPIRRGISGRPPRREGGPTATAPLPPHPPSWIPFLPAITIAGAATVVLLLAFRVLSPFTVFVAFWAFVAPVLTYIFVAALKGLRGILREPTEGAVARSRVRLNFVFAAKFCPPFVAEGVASVHAACKTAGYTNYEVFVATEVARDVPGATVVVVPEAYACEAKYKARALNYTLQFLSDANDVWNLHLDEDSKIVPQTVGAILSFIEEHGDRLVIANGLNVGTYNRNLISFVAEALRPISFAWHHSYMKRGRALWMYGSNLLIRSDVEHYITWNTGLYNAEMAGEDALFGYKTYRALGPVFGWHGGLSIERAPSTLRGTLKQRRRWFFSGVSLIRSCPERMRPLRLYAAGGWAAGMFIMAFSVVRTLGWFEHANYIGIPVWFVLLGIWLVSFWLSKIQLDIYLTLKHNGSQMSRARRLAWHLLVVVVAPVAGLFIVGGPLVALLFPPKGFQITDK